MSEHPQVAPSDPDGFARKPHDPALDWEDCMRERAAPRDGSAVVSGEQQCERCGMVIVNAPTHRRFHVEIDAWIEVIEVELEGDFPVGHPRRGRFGP
jgi:hypothetical protein